MKNITVITGGGGGVGLATAKIMGKKHYVILCDVSQDRLDDATAELKALAIDCESYVCDITDRKSVDELVQYVQKIGRITSVIHTAGVSPLMTNAELIMKINAIGTINVNEAFYEIAHEGFSCVNVASMAGYLMPEWLIPKRAYKYFKSNQPVFLKKVMFWSNIMPKKLRSGQAYSISKNFVMWYSKTQAAKFGSKGARIVSVSPGSIDTEMGRLEEKSGSGKILEFAALKRFGRPEEVGELLAFCASDKASYITGVDIPCDGGVVATITFKDLMSLSNRSH